MQTPPQILAALLDLHAVEDLLTASKLPHRSPSLQARKDSLRKLLPPTILSHHDGMRARGKRSAAPIRHGVCCGCFIAVPSGKRSHIESGKDLQLCQTCGRFLYLETAGTGPTAPAPMKPTRARRGRPLRPGTHRRLPKVLTLEPGRRRGL